MIVGVVGHDEFVSSETQNLVADWMVRSDHPAVDEKWVPGATLSERRALAALGGLVSELADGIKLPTLPSDVERWITEGPTVPKHIVQLARTAISASPDTEFAALYASLVRGEHRRPLGTFFTPTAEVNLMLDLWSNNQSSPRAVIDVGAGVGVFTAAAMIRWPDATVYSIDINPVTLGLLAARVAREFRLLGDGDSGPGIRLILDDFNRWMQTDWKNTADGRLIIGNPPYTRSQLISTEDRKRLHKQAFALCGRRASLSTLITAIALKSLGPRDGLCLLLPAQWLESQYAQTLRERLWLTTKRHIEMRLVDSWQFADAQVDAVALLVGVEEREPAGFVVGNWKNEFTNSLSRESKVPDNWRSLFCENNRTDRATQPAKGTMLGDLAVLRRGVATGANHFFLVSDLELEMLGLPRHVIVPAIHRLASSPDALTERTFSRMRNTEKRWLLTFTIVDRETIASVNDYVCWGELRELHKGRLCQLRNTWYDIHHDLFRPDVVIGSMTRTAFRVVENRVNAAITNNLYGWRWRNGISIAMQKRTIAWLKSGEGQEGLNHAARRQAHGLRKLEPSALRNLHIPATVTKSFRSALGSTEQGALHD